MSDPTTPPPADPTPPGGSTPPPPPGAPAPPPPAVTPAPTSYPASSPAYPAAPPSYPTAPPSDAPGGAPQNGMGTAALIMGILQFLCLGTIGSILAIIFGKIGMNKAKAGLATNGGMAKAGFWLGIVGVILSVIGIIVAIILVVFVGKTVSDSIDPARNSETGLADGSYVMAPNTSLRLNDRCSFSGETMSLDAADFSTTRVTVVGSGSIECAGTGTPDAVGFTVTGGVAKITQVQ